MGFFYSVVRPSRMVVSQAELTAGAFHVAPRDNPAGNKSEMVAKGTDSMADDPFQKVRAVVEKRINEQLERHFSISPNADPTRIIELQIAQEKERLQLRLDRLLNTEKRDEIGEMSLRYLIDEWLPTFERKLKRR